ncbi:hypothetical protein [Azospirillum sp.]|uniref:hypothetical protein n=1 Tax=Azospirillum sp. TaxID=34012 RepID=UPI003D73EC34
MHRTLIAGMSVAALVAVTGCAQDRTGTDAGTAGASGSRSTASASGSSGDPGYGVAPQNRRSGNSPGAGMPIEPANDAPSLSPGTLSGDAGKRTTGETGGN